MLLNDLYFDLPSSLIAQTPPKNRTDSRLLVSTSNIIDTYFSQIVNFLQPGDLLVMNDTKVIPARLFANKKTGGNVEIMIERILDKTIALAMIKHSGKLRNDSFLILENSTKVKIVSKQDDIYKLEFYTESIFDLLDNIGHIPLPPYIKRADNQDDLKRYQTIYAKKAGAVAAPTAGLHFDNKLLELLKKKNINHCFVTLHVGSATFKPIKNENIKNHKMHSEYFEINQSVIDQINKTKQSGGRIIAVGTTSVRVLEASYKNLELKAQKGETDIFIYPGYNFKVVDMMITNFHLPYSSLLALVAAFIGYEKMIKIYKHAIEQKYRFFSYGDAMLLNKT
jgi:S-adenosylmethionine:tRNA ribosyltransferase-isomerase